LVAQSLPYPAATTTTTTSQRIPFAIHWNPTHILHVEQDLPSLDWTALRSSAAFRRYQPFQLPTPTSHMPAYYSYHPTAYTSHANMASSIRTSSVRYSVASASWQSQVYPQEDLTSESGVFEYDEDMDGLSGEFLGGVVVAASVTSPLPFTSLGVYAGVPCLLLSNTACLCST